MNNWIQTGKLYKLTCDVVNPNPDRRQRYDWTRLPVWEAGTVFRVSERTYGGGLGGHSVLALWTGRWAHMSLAIATPENSDGRWTAPQALLDALEELAPTHAEQALSAHGLERWLDSAVTRLVREGKLTYDDLVRAARAEHDMPDEERA